jgi:rRNA biogenesis protein RRP5
MKQLVQGKILRSELFHHFHFTNLSVCGRVNPENSQVEMTLRSKPVDLTLGDFQENQKVDGIIRKSEPYGVFIQIKNTKISGLCHKSQVIIIRLKDLLIVEILSDF